MKRKLVLLLLTAALFAALLSCAAVAEGWTDRASESSPVYPLTAVCEPGDMDGDGALAPSDARIVLRLSVGLDKDSTFYGSADVDGDGAITPADARLVLRYAVGLDGYTPPRADDGAYAAGLWSFRSDQDDILCNYYMDRLLAQTVNEVTAEDVRNGAIPLWRLCSTEDAGRFENDMVYWSGIDTHFPSPELKNVLRRYDDTFFEKRELLLALDISGNGDAIPAVYPPETDDGTLTITVGSASKLYQTPIIVNRLLLLPVSKESAEGVAAYNARRGKSLTLTEQEYQAAGEGQTKWEFAGAHLLGQDDSAGLLTGGVYYAALKNTRGSGTRWVCEADCEIREYRSEELTLGRDSAGNYLYVREETVAAPGASDEYLQYFIIAAPFPGDYTLRFRRTQPLTAEAAAEEDGGYTVSLSVKKTEPTVTETVRLATENGAVATSSQAPFDLNSIILGRSSLMGRYNNCRFRGVIEAIDRYTVSWKNGEGKDCGPYPRAILKVRVSQNYSGLSGRDYVNILYVYDWDDGPIEIKTGQEYIFLDCRLLDDDYYAKAAAVLPDFVEKDETLRLSDVIAGPAKYTFLPIDDGNCTVYREYLSEEQLRMKGDPPEIPWHPPFFGADYVTIELESMEVYLITLESRQNDMFF